MIYFANYFDVLFNKRWIIQKESIAKTIKKGSISHLIKTLHPY